MKKIFIANTNNKKIEGMLKLVKRNCVDYSEIKDSLERKELSDITNFSVKTAEKIAKKYNISDNIAKKMEREIFISLHNFLKIMLSARRKLSEMGYNKIELFNTINISGLAITAAAEHLGITISGHQRKPRNRRVKYLFGIVRGPKWFFLPGTHATKFAVPLLKKMPDASILFIEKENKDFLENHGIKGKNIKIKMKRDDNFDKNIDNFLEVLRKENLCFKGIPFWKYFMGVLDCEFKREYYSFISYGIEKFIKEQSPSVLILYHESMFSGRTSVLECHKNGIPTVQLQHGVFARKDLIEKFIIARTNADKLCVWSNDMKKWLVGEDVPARKIIATGSPMYDKLLQTRKSFHEEYDIVFATPAFEEERCVTREEYQKFLENIVEKTKGKRVIIKLHPRDDKNLYKNIPIEIKTGSIDEYIVKTKTLITFDSTVVFDALIQRKNVILMDKLVKAPKTIFNNNKFIHEPKSFDELDINFEAKVHEKLIKKFLEEHLFKLDGKASERIKDAINKITRS